MQFFFTESYLQFLRIYNRYTRKLNDIFCTLNLNSLHHNNYKMSTVKRSIQTETGQEKDLCTKIQREFYFLTNGHAHSLTDSVIHEG